MENHEKERDWAAFLAAQQGIPHSEVGKTRTFASPLPKKELPCVTCAHREVCMHVPTVQRMKEKIDEAVKDVKGDAHVASGLTIDFIVSMSCPQYRLEYPAVRGESG